MPFYIVLAEDRDGGSAQRIAHRQEHVNFWQSQGNVVKLAGAILERSAPKGSALVLEAESEAVVRQMMAKDPFTARDVFSDAMQVIEIRPAIGEWMPRP